MTDITDKYEKFKVPFHTNEEHTPDEFDPKHPQLYPPRTGPDPQALRNPRPESDLAEQRQIQWGWNPVGFNYQPGLSPEDNLVATGSVGTVVVIT